MKKAIVSLIKRIEINISSENPLLKEIFDNAYPEIWIALQGYQFNNYSIHVNGSNSNIKVAVDKAATLGGMNSILRLKKIPNLSDDSGRIIFKVPSESGKYPKVRVEVLEFVYEDKDKLRLAIYFESEYLILLDSISDKLLLAFPSANEEESATQKKFDYTFFLQLTADLYFGTYSLLE